MKKLVLTALLWLSAAVAPAQTTAVYLLSDGAELTTFSNLGALRAEVTARAAAGEFCSLSAFRLDVSIVDGVPETTSISLPITAAGADVVEPVASAPQDCDEACPDARAAFPDPPGVPAPLGEACDCFQILDVPPQRVRGDLGLETPRNRRESTANLPLPVDYAETARSFPLRSTH